MSDPARGVPTDPIFSAVPLRSRWRRPLQIGSFLVVALVSGFLLLRVAHEPPPPRTAGTPVPVIIVTNVSYGTITVDDVAVTTSPNSQLHPVLLTPGHRIIQLSASPFHPIRCSLDTATLTQPGTSARCATIGIPHPLPVFNMNFTSDDLPPEVTQQLLDALPLLLNPTSRADTVVASQTHYATGNGPSLPLTAVASTPLQAHLQLVFDAPGRSFNTCDALFCSDGIAPEQSLSAPGYVAFRLPIRLLWQVNTPAGQSVATYAEPEPSQLQRGTFRGFMTLYFRYAIKTRWQMVDPTTTFNSSPLQQQTNRLLCDKGATLVFAQIPPSRAATPTIIGSQSLSGCLFFFAIPPSLPLPLAADPLHDPQRAWFLVHYGAVLAVNDAAHALVPTVEQATLTEVTEILTLQQHP